MDGSPVEIFTASTAQWRHRNCGCLRSWPLPEEAGRAKWPLAAMAARLRAGDAEAAVLFVGGVVFRRGADGEARWGDGGALAQCTAGAGRI